MNLRTRDGRIIVRANNPDTKRVLARACRDREPTGNLDLRGKDLSGADLRGARLNQADLRNANLSHAKLDGASFRNADLRGANLANASAEGADFQGADLRGANLPWCGLFGARWKGATLEEVGIVAKEPIQIRTEAWPVVIFDRHIAFGCRLFGIAEALAMPDEDVEAIRPGALAWWRKWKPAIEMICGLGRG